MRWRSTRESSIALCSRAAPTRVRIASPSGPTSAGGQLAGEPQSDVDLSQNVTSWSKMDGVGTAGARIGFICMTPAHLDKNGALVDHLTIHETDWAYCPSNVRTDGHDWKATGGVSMGELEILVRGMRERAGVNGDSPKKDR